MHSPLTLSSDDPTLVQGFAWARSQALAYVFTGDPAGDWYEAALPGRAAFCMRDVSHQAAGAQALGLARWNYNMLHRFAENITAERDWCSLWEIDRFNRPCPADYRDNGYFWYNFPANFDVLDCCYRQYLWTADPRYLSDPQLRYFYAKSTYEYVRRWDRDGDGRMEHYPEYGSRGIATYNEEIEDPRIGGDLIAAQFAAYQSYAGLLALEGREPDAAAFRALAAGLQADFAAHWWDAQHSRCFGFIGQDGAFAPDPDGMIGQFALYFNLLETPERVQSLLDELERVETHMAVEPRSYTSEILFRYGRDRAANQVLRELFAPDLQRREYPELSFSLLGALVGGLMGVQPDARERVVATCPHLSQPAGWVEMSAIPVFDNQLTVRHQGVTETHLTVQSGRPLYWRAAFAGCHETIEVDGRAWPAACAETPAGVQSSVLLRVAPGETHVARISVPSSKP